MAKSDSARPPGPQLALAFEDQRFWASARARPHETPTSRAVSSRELQALAQEAERIFVYSQADWHHAAAYAKVQPTNERVVILGPVVAVLMPWLPCYRWPDVLGEVGLGRGGAEKLFDLSEVLREHARRAPGRLRALWQACLSARQAEAVGLEAQTTVGAELAVMTAAAFMETAQRCRQKATPSISGSELVELTDSVFAEDGGLPKAHPAFEPREGQRRLARSVAEAFLREEILLAEAGTGIGKSLAYLVPAALWAMTGHRPVVIATFTRNLQDQLRQRDVPILKDALARELDVLVVKGRSNYLCVQRLLDRLEESSTALFREGLATAGFLASWAIQTPGGDLESISPEATELFPDLADAIEDVRAHYYRCALTAGLPCPAEQCCLLRRLRSAAEKADIIITNQALLMADLSHDVLPDYRYLVIDEAHHLEEAATKALTASVGTASLADLSRWLRDAERRRGVAGAMAEAEQLLGTAARWVSEEGTGWQAWLDAWDEATHRLEESVVDLLCEEVRQPEEPLALLLDTAGRAHSRWAAVEKHAAAVASLAEEGAQALQELVASLTDMEHDENVDARRSATVLAGTALALADIAATLERVIAGQAGDVAWAEVEPDGRRLRWNLCVAPVEVADALAEKLYRPLRAIIFTGATLTADRSFAFLRRACGLETYAHRVVELQVPSPFDWQNRLLLCLPTDVAAPGSHQHEKTVIETIQQLAAMSGGGLLALFTARRRMLSAFEALEKPLKAAGLSVLCQDVSGERWWLMHQMRTDPRTVVFGVRSLWEGVDVPGHHLRCVVVEKLPFAVPDEPLVAARTRYLDEQGLDGYNSYYVPEAIRALRQAVGRVLRTAKDYGVVFILDPRIHTRSYGRRFLRSLPPATICAASLQETLAKAREWLSRENESSAWEEPPRCT